MHADCLVFLATLGLTVLEIAEFIEPTPSPLWRLAKQAGVDLAVGGLPFDSLEPGEAPVGLCAVAADETAL